VTIDEQVAAVERDRTRRENGLTLFLLALVDKSRSFVNKAIRVGWDWTTVLRAVLLGDEQLDQQGGIPILSRAMAETHLAGVSRVGRLLGVPVAPRRAIDDLTTIYRSRATDALESIRGTLEGAIDEGLREAAEADRINADIRAVTEAYRAKGWTGDNPYGAETAATAVVTQSYASGMRDAYGEDAVRAVMTGLRFVAVLDEATTTICRVRNGVIRPLDDPYWTQGGWPPLHFSCRSVVLPTTGRVQFTEDPPTSPPPDAGWGSYSGML
jgi:SPP1 gp7 family putative phage head morphogenesis protein